MASRLTWCSRRSRVHYVTERPSKALIMCVRFANVPSCVIFTQVACWVRCCTVYSDIINCSPYAHTHRLWWRVASLIICVSSCSLMASLPSCSQRPLLPLPRWYEATKPINNFSKLSTPPPLPQDLPYSRYSCLWLQRSNHYSYAFLPSTAFSATCIRTRLLKRKSLTRSSPRPANRPSPRDKSSSQVYSGTTHSPIGARPLHSRIH